MSDDNGRTGCRACQTRGQMRAFYVVAVDAGISSARCLRCNFMSRPRLARGALNIMLGLPTACGTVRRVVRAAIERDGS